LDLQVKSKHEVLEKVIDSAFSKLKTTLRTEQMKAIFNVETKLHNEMKLPQEQDEEVKSNN